MSTLHWAMAWRFGLTASLASVRSHILVRFDDGETCFNIEATQAGFGGFSSSPDEVYIEKYNLPEIATACGSDLRALLPHEVLGIFVGLRARHVQDVAMLEQGNQGAIKAQPDWLVARQLFPNNRELYRNQMIGAALLGFQLFESGEAGHPRTLAHALQVEA